MAIDLSAVNGMTPSGLAVPGYIEEEIKQTRRLREEQELVAAAIRGAAAATSAGASGFSAMGEAVGSVSKLLNSLHGQFGATVKDATDLSLSLQAVSGSAPNDIAALSASLAISSGKAKAATNDVLSLGAAFGALKGHIAKNIGDWALQGVEKLVDVQREFDKLNTTMAAATGSSANAAREFEWLRQFAMDTPVSLAEVTQGFLKMKAAGLEPTQEAMTSFSNTATAMGLDFGKMIDAVTDATDGKFGGLEQLGISAKKEGDNVALTFQGVTTTVKNSSEEIAGYIEKIGNTTFDGTTARHAQTLDGTLSKLSHTWDELFRVINEGDIGTFILNSVTLANGVLRDAVAILKAVGGAAGDAGKDLGALSLIQSGIATVFETVAVLGVNLKYVLVSIGNEIGGLIAQIAQGAQAAGRFLTGDFTGAKESASAFAEIRRQMVVDAEAARKEVDATTTRIVNARNAVKESSQQPSNPAANTPPSSNPRPRDAEAGNSSATPAKPASPKAVAAEVRGDPAVCCCDNKAAPAPSAQTATVQPSQPQQQPQGKGVAAASAPGQADAKAAAKAAVAVVASSASSSSLNVVIPPAKGPAAPSAKPEVAADAYAQATEEIRKQTVELAKQRATLQASIDTLGKNEIEIAKQNVKQTKERLDAAAKPGSEDHQPDRIAALQKLLAEQEKTAETKEDADYSKRSHALKEQIEQSRENNALVQQEINLTGMSQLERSKIAALRTIEVRQAKELNEIRKSGHSEENKKELSDKVKEKSRIDAETEVQKLVQADWQKTADQINGSLTDAFMKSLESGKDFGKNLREALKEQFKSLVLKPTISAVMSPISGFFSSLVSGVSAGITGGTGGGGGGIGNLFSLGSAGYQAYTGQGLVGQGLSALSRSLGYGVMTSNMGTASVLTSTGAVSKAALDGTIALGSNAVPGAYAGMGSWGAGGIAGLIAMAVINAFGGMRSETMIGSGLRGTLDGKRTLDPWEEWREGGTILSGPEFSTGNPLELIKELRKKIDDYHALPDEVQNSPQSVTAWQTILAELERTHAGLEEQVNKQSKAINEGYNALRTNIVGMANSIGLAGDKIKDFAFVLETQDLNFQGLKPEEIQEKITKVMDKAGNSMAKELLGYMKPVTETITRTVAHGEGSMGEDRHVWYTQETETTTKMVYQASEYAKAGETVLETLTRLSTAFNALNDASNSLGFGLHEGSVALADFASDFIEAFGGLEQFSASTSLFLQNYYSDEERRQAMARTGAIRAQELGIDIDAEGILNLSKQDVRNAANSLVDDPVAYRKALDLANYLAPLYQVTEAVEQAVEPTQSLATAVDELTEKFNGAKEALLNDAKSLSVDLLRAQGKEGDAKALERQQYLDGFVDEHGNKLDEGRLQQLTTLYDGNAATRRAIDVQNERNGLQDELNSLTDDATQALTRQRDALDESNRALFDNVQAIKLQKTIADELPGVVDKYLSPAQRRQSQYDKVTADLNAVGIKVSAEQLMGLSRAQIGSAAMDIYNTAGVPDEARLAVVRAAGALADLKNADVDTAFAALERAVDAQRKVLDEAITELTSVFETARDAAKTLFGQVESAVQFQGDEGRAFISNALAVAQSTGYLPESKEFSKAVSDATGALGQQMFATQAESDYQRLVLANELKGLQDISGDQLEKAKDELEYLDEQLAEQRKQIDVLNGIDLSVQSVAGAISALGTAMNGARSATTMGGSGLAAYDTELGVGRNAAGTLFQRDDIRLAASNALEAGANPRDIYNVIKGSGFTLAQAGVILGTEPGSLESFAREMDWPVFHRGTRRVPRTGFALLQQGEAVIPAAYNPFAAGRGWGNSKDMLAAMEGVRAELIEVRRQNDALQRAAMRTADAVNGRPEAPMLVESV